MTEAEFSYGNGLFLGIENNCPVLVARREELQGTEFINKNEKTTLIGRIVYMALWDGIIDYETY